MYNRPQISEVYLLGLKRLQKIKDFDILVCCSDAASIDLCEKYNIDWFFYENHPLGLKHNVLFRTALENYKFDYLIHSGDDDVLTDKGFQELISLIERGEKYIVNKNLYSNHLEKGLDFSSHSKLIECGVEAYYTNFCEIVDIKSKVNITDYN
jgi:hypothetical protein